MVGAEHFDDTVGEPRPGAPEIRLSAVDTAAPEPGSYWADIDYPEPGPRTVVPPAPAATPARPARSRRVIAAVVAAIVVVGAGSYAVGRMNGHAPVPGLHRTIDSQRAALRARATTIKSQAATIASDEAQLGSVHSELSQTTSVEIACRGAVADAVRAFTAEAGLFSALDDGDTASANLLADQFETAADQFDTARTTCVGSGSLQI
jgi:hypothetical protein